VKEQVLSDEGEGIRDAIVDLVQARDQKIGGTCHRTRAGLQALVDTPDRPMVQIISGLDEHGMETWLELQRLTTCALQGLGGIEAVEAAADSLGVRESAHPRP